MMFGVLVIVLCRDRVADLGFSAGGCSTSVSMRAWFSRNDSTSPYSWTSRNVNLSVARLITLEHTLRNSKRTAALATLR
jgi:hypothetical protein